MYICPSTKSLSDFNEIWGVGGGRWVIHDIMYCTTRSKVKVIEIWNVQKWPVSKSISSASMHVTKRLTVNYGTPNVNFNWTLGLFHLRQMNIASYEESTSSPVRVLFICCQCVSGVSVCLSGPVYQWWFHWSCLVNLSTCCRLWRLTSAGAAWLHYWSRQYKVGCL